MRKILLTMLTIELLLGLAMTPAFAASQKDKEEVFKETKKLCSMFLEKCTITEIEYPEMNAFTTLDNNIRVSKKLIEGLNKDELRSVMFHEVGHVVHDHVEHMLVYLTKCNTNQSCDSTYINLLRKQYEYEADRFSVKATLVMGKPEALKSALIKLSRNRVYNSVKASHPRTEDRIKRIDKIMGR